MLAFTLLVSVQHRAHGFPLDDSYIHQTVARNLAEHGSLGFVIGKRSSGATSLLWTLIQASRYRLLGSVDPVWFNIALSYALLVSIALLLYRIAYRDGLPQPVCLLLAATPALSGNFLWLGLIGMEHLLFVFFSLLAIYLWFDPEPHTLLNSAAAGFVSGLLVITRPEAVVFGPLMLVASLRFRRRRSRRELVVFALPWGAFLALSLSVNWWTSGALMPATLKGRTWLYFHSTGGAHSVRSITRFCGSWVQRLPRHFSTHFTHQMVSVREIFTGESLFGIALLALVLVGAVALLRRRPLAVTFLLLWAAIHFTIYMVSFPAGGHGGRYQPLNLLLFFPLLFLGCAALLGRLLPRRHNIVAGTVVALALIAAYTSISTWRTVAFVGISHINDTHGRIALWMRQNIPSNARFAAFDIGRVSYDWPSQVIDLGGLVDPTYYHYLRDGDVPLYLQRENVEYLLLPSAGTEDFGFTPEMTAHPLIEFCSPREPWLLGFRYTIHATQCQRLYRLATRPENDEPGPSPQPAH